MTVHDPVQTIRRKLLPPLLSLLLAAACGGLLVSCGGGSDETTPPVAGGGTNPPAAGGGDQPVNPPPADQPADQPATPPASEPVPVNPPTGGTTTTTPPAANNPPSGGWIATDNPPASGGYTPPPAASNPGVADVGIQGTMGNVGDSIGLTLSTNAPNITAKLIVPDISKTAALTRSGNSFRFTPDAAGVYVIQLSDGTESRFLQYSVKSKETFAASDFIADTGSSAGTGALKNEYEFYTDQSPATVLKIMQAYPGVTIKFQVGRQLIVQAIQGSAASITNLQKLALDPRFKFSGNRYISPPSILGYIPDDGPDSTFGDYSGANWHLDKISATQAWDITRGSKDVAIGISDAYLYTNHEEVAGRIDDAAVSPPSEHSEDDTHGTEVFTTIAGNANNKKGVTGINHISPLTFQDYRNYEDGSDGYRDFNDACGVDDKKKRVTSYSHGITTDKTLDELYRRMQAADSNTGRRQAAAENSKCLITILAGNGSKDTGLFGTGFWAGAWDSVGTDAAYSAGGIQYAVEYNTDYLEKVKSATGSLTLTDYGNAATVTRIILPNVLVVAAVDIDGKLASYSNFGESVEIAAPTGFKAGTRVKSGQSCYEVEEPDTSFSVTDPFGSLGFFQEPCSEKNALSPYGQGGGFNGTSAATPVVAGVASLVFSRYPQLTAEQVKTILIESAKQHGDIVTKRKVKNGPDEDLKPPLYIVNAKAALDYAATVAAGPQVYTLTASPTADVLAQASLATQSALTGTAMLRVNQPATFKVTGINLKSASLTLSMDDCGSNLSPIAGSLTDTEARFQCTPKGAGGLKNVKVQSPSAGSALKPCGQLYCTIVTVLAEDGTQIGADGAVVNDPNGGTTPPTPPGTPLSNVNVTWMQANNFGYGTAPVALGLPVQFEITGVGLPSSVTLSVNGCPSLHETSRGSGGDAIFFQCDAITGAAGATYNATVLNGGTQIYQISVPTTSVALPWVVNVQSVDANFATEVAPKMGQTAHFLVVGNNLPNTLTLNVQDCGNNLTPVSLGDSTFRRYECTFTSTGSKTISVLGAAGGMTSATVTVGEKLRVLSIAAGVDANHTCAVMSDGSVKCWGYNGSGALLGISGELAGATAVTANGLSGVTATVGGWLFRCALLDDGTVKCSGTGPIGTNLLVSIALNGKATAIAAGLSHVCALLSSGAINCWGDNQDGQLGDGTTNSASTPVPVNVLGGAGVTAITATGENTCALLSGGTVQCWGYPSPPSTDFDNGLTDSSTSVPVTGLSGVTAITGGLDHACALLSNGNVKCWGYNFSGQLGGSTANVSSSTPVLVNGLSGVTAITAGNSYTCALLSNGDVKCWGDNSHGQLGSGATTTSSITPVLINGLSGVTAITAGGNHTCALLSGGSVECWGLNGNGQLGNGTTTDSSVPVAVIGLTGSDTAAATTATTRRLEGAANSVNESASATATANSWRQEVVSFFDRQVNNVYAFFTQLRMKIADALS